LLIRYRAATVGDETGYREWRCQGFTLVFLSLKNIACMRNALSGFIFLKTNVA